MPLPTKPTKIDLLTLDDHWHLQPEDDCWYLGEYTSGKGFAFSEINQLILNFKKSVDKQGTSEYQYKLAAIEEITQTLKDTLRPNAGEAGSVYVPIPPSKASRHPLYDDRVYEALQGTDLRLDIRKLIVQTESTAASHFSQARPSPSDLFRRYEIDTQLSSPTPERIVVVDDVVTTGAHFKAAQTLLAVEFPGVPVSGLFIARRALSSEGD